MIKSGSTAILRGQNSFFFADLCKSSRSLRLIPIRSRKRTAKNAKTRKDPQRQSASFGFSQRHNNLVSISPPLREAIRPLDNRTPSFIVSKQSSRFTRSEAQEKRGPQLCNHL